MTKQIITSAMLDDTRKRGEQSILLLPNALITPQAADDARRYGITFVQADAGSPTPMANTAPVPVPSQVATQSPIVSPVVSPVAPATAYHLVPVATEMNAGSAIMSGISMPVQAIPSFMGASCASEAACSYLRADKAQPLVGDSCASQGSCALLMAQPHQAFPTAHSCASEAACARVLPPAPMAQQNTFQQYKPAQANGDAVFEEARRRVMAALPPNTSKEEVNKLVRNALGDTYHFCEGCNNTAPCPIKAQATQASNAVTRVGQVDHVNAQALSFGAAHTGAIGLMDVLEPSTDANAHVGYLQGDNASMTWAPEQAEVLVVLEGKLTLSVDTSTINAAPGDVLRIGKGQTVTLVTQGFARCTLVSA